MAGDAAGGHGAMELDVGLRDDAALTSAPTSGPVWVPGSTMAIVPMVLLLCALSYATEAQGAFYPGPFHGFVVLVALALVAAIATHRTRSWIRSVATDPVVVMAVVLSLVTEVSAGAAGHWTAATGTVAALLTLAGAVAVVRGLTPDHRRLLVAGLVTLGSVVAVVGWVAVVARWQPDALVSQGLWRASSTLTYENALAAYLTAPALLALDRLLSRGGGDLGWREASYLLLLGVGASLSRGGLLGLAIGFVALVLLHRGRTLVQVVPVLLGTVTAVACLAPGVPVGASPHVVLAIVGLAAGAVISAAPVTLDRRRGRLAAGVLGGAVVALVLAVAVTGRGAGEIARVRLSAASSDRAHEWGAAWTIARHHLALGVGAARVLLQWQVGGKLYTATFAHNEFLQLLVQDGVVGLAVLVAGLTWMTVRLARRRGGENASSGTWVTPSCAIACLVALVVESSLDFVWHLPVIPVLVAVVLAAALDDRPTASPPETTRSSEDLILRA
ncbi:MAG: O-antigen ligase family protein [Acidimicrobiales bacterium]